MDGTIFLDEIGELNITLQAKLLRVLQEREIERLGTNKKTKVNFRLVSSTNKDLKLEVERGNFRQDLFYRLNVVKINVPPLRERKQDIPLLSVEFLQTFSLQENRPFFLSDEVMEIFMGYDWPGNVRQLRNVIERAAAFARGERITINELPEELHCRRRSLSLNSTVKPLKMLERQAVTEALQVFRGNKSRAARSLGISRKTFYKRLS